MSAETTGDRPPALRAMPAGDSAPRFHTIGVGAGPANLSLAALFEAVAPHRLALFEQSPGPSWHPELLHAGVRMQTSWLKDLVSLVDPQHRLSFLSYLVRTGRVYAFLSAKYDAIPRVEYARYLAWATDQLEHVHHGTPIERIAFDDGFGIYADGRLLARSDHLVLGLGTRPKLPAAFAGLSGDRVLLAEDVSRQRQRLAVDPDARLAVVGGGQTGAECVLELLRIGCRDIWWFGRRPWFQALDDGPSANDFYRPSYTRFLPELPADARRRMGEEQVLTTDGITEATLREIYQRNYEELLVTGRNPVTLLPGREVLAARTDRHGLLLTCAEPAGAHTYDARYLVVAAGREEAPLPFDERLRELVVFDDRGQPVIDADFSVRWRGPGHHKLFAQNRGWVMHGLADRSLSLLAVRSATIINALFEREVFTIEDAGATTHWGGEARWRPALAGKVAAGTLRR